MSGYFTGFFGISPIQWWQWKFIVGLDGKCYFSYGHFIFVVRVVWMEGVILREDVSFLFQVGF